MSARRNEVRTPGPAPQDAIPTPIPAMNHPTDTTAEMNSQAHALRHDLEQLAQDARALLTATSDVAGEKVAEARKRLADALEHRRDFYAIARDKALEASCAADGVVRDNLYQIIGFGVGAGILLGFMLATRCPCRCE